MMSIINGKLSKVLSSSAALMLLIGVAAQSLATAQAEGSGYVQADCPNIVKQAIDTVSAQCGKTARGKLCYGNSTITAQYQPGANNIKFSAPGDTVDISALKQFTLGQMDTSANTWGVAEMKIKADLPDADPSQAVTMIMFGSVQLTDGSADANAAVPGQTATAKAQRPTSVAPLQTSTAIALDQAATRAVATSTKIAGLESTATAKAALPAPTGTIPAIKATQSAATMTQLANLVNTATAAANPGPVVPGRAFYSSLQAFYFQSSDTAPCEQAPHDGILIQSPQNSKQQVTLVIDGALISLESTVYITAQPGQFLTVNTLEGSAVVTVGGITQIAGAGTAVRVPINSNLRASGAPLDPAFYVVDTVRGLPTAILPVTTLAFMPGIPSDAIVGTWSQLDNFVCSTSVSTGLPRKNTRTVSIAYNQTTMWYVWLNNGILLTRSAQGDYEGQLINSGVAVYSLKVENRDHITGTVLLTSPTLNCTNNLDITRIS